MRTKEQQRFLGHALRQTSLVFSFKLSFCFISLKTDECQTPAAKYLFTKTLMQIFILINPSKCSKMLHTNLLRVSLCIMPVFHAFP